MHIFNTPCRLVLLVGLTILLSGCEPFSWSNYRQAVQSGRQQIRVVQEMEALFPEDVQNFIGNSPGTLPMWNSEVLLHDRYVFTMQVQIRVNRSFSKVTEVVGEPMFFIGEVLEVDSKARGSHIGQNWDFGLQEWNRVVAAGGDFSVIGVELKDDQPVERFQQMYQEVRRQREPPP